MIAAFESKFIPEPNSGCFIWIGAASELGYGRFRFNGTVQGAHRVSWQLANGPIPDGMHVLHRCDVPSCVRPEHLFIGTDLDNVRDMHAKGRWIPWGRAVTHCYRGHEYTAENTYRHSGTRHCKECGRISARAHQQKRSAALKGAA